MSDRMRLGVKQEKTPGLSFPHQSQAIRHVHNAAIGILRTIVSLYLRP
ncbi:hypothetical protein LOC67_21250 [Stieleria sp. JC731]|nr:hypothetical protein [Stieleria sp. JC731]